MRLGRRRTWCAWLLVLGLCGLAAPAAYALRWSAPRTIDDAAPFGNANSINAFSCPSPRLCVGGDTAGNLLVSGQPGGGRGAWRLVNISTFAITGVSCPSTAFCVAVDSGGEAFSSENPAGGSTAWSLATVGKAALTAVACAGTQLCVATDTRGRALVSSTPATGGGAWRQSMIDPGSVPNAVACPSATLCVIADASGGVLTATDPAGGPAAWTRTKIDDRSLLSLSCPDKGLCVAGDSDGAVLSSQDPAAGSGAWMSAGNVGPGPDPRLVSLSCPSDSFCAGATSGGSVVTAVQPDAPADAWSATPIGMVPRGMVCVTESFCLAGTDDGQVITSTSPSETNVWRATPVDGVDSLESVACRPGLGCVAGDNAARVFTTGRPTGAWHTHAIGAGNPGVYGLACPSRSRCLALVTQGDVPGAPSQGGGSLFTFAPAGGPASWRAVAIAQNDDASGFDRLACPTSSLCLTADDMGAVFAAGGPLASGWQAAPRLRPLEDAACPSPTLCLAPAPGAGRVIVRSGVAPRATARTITIAGASGAIRAVACTTPGTFCAILDDAGDVLTSDRPARGAGWAWAHVDDALTTGIACLSPAVCVVVDDRGRVVVGTR